MGRQHNNRNYIRGYFHKFDGVAPPDVIAQDFSVMESKVSLRCSYDVEQMLIMQSIEGHAHGGQGKFYGKTYPNTTQDDIAQALKLDPVAVKADRQALIDEIRTFIDSVCDDKNPEYACNIDGEPLIRCGFFRQYKIDADALLTGLYIGGLRDDSEIRKVANERYNADLGYGKGYKVNREVMARLGLNGFALAREGHENDIANFEKSGLFSGNEDTSSYMYIRYKEGMGASDDLAVIMAGKLFGISAAIGCFLADAIDTLEKYSSNSGDQDFQTALYIENKYKRLKATRDDASDLAFLCAIPNHMASNMPDSSLRHLLEIDKKIDQCTIESHLCYIANQPYSFMDLDKGQCTNDELYDYAEGFFSSFKPKRD